MTSFATKFIDGSARLELNLPDEPVNKISRAVRQELESVLDSIASARAIPDAELVWIKDAGHWLIDEKPDEIGDRINQFLG